MKTITIQEETKIPDTNIILEKGDRIRVNEVAVKSLKESFFRELHQYFTEYPDSWEAGLEISNDIINAAKKAGMDVEQVSWGMWQTISDYTGR